MTSGIAFSEIVNFRVVREERIQAGLSGGS
jgi:hypothetical protein